MTKTIKLAHGNGGVENRELIWELFYRAFENKTLLQSEDAAVIEEGRLAFTTDSFTVSPLFFAGGDIGKLAVCGTCNDLAMMGAKPKYLTCSFILEEGFSTDELKRIVASMKKELEINGVSIVSGDTKVVPKGAVDKIFINTTGIGEIQRKGVSANSIRVDDVIIVSRDIGSHGATIFANREGIEMSSTLMSDCSSLYMIVEKLLKSNSKIVAMRDATRGGLSAVLNEWAEASNVCIEIEEQSVPIGDEVIGLCEMLGFDALTLANEGTFVLAVKSEDAKEVLKVLQEFNQNATIIGLVTNNKPTKVILNSSWGTQRYLESPTGELLPRIC